MNVSEVLNFMLKLARFLSYSIDFHFNEINHKC